MSIDNLIKSILSNWQECDGVEIAVSFSNNEFSASVIEDGLCVVTEWGNTLEQALERLNDIE